MRNFLALSIAIAFLSSCGDTSSPKNSSDLNAQLPCTKTNCPDATLAITVSGEESGVLVGTLNGTVTWTFTGAAEKGSSRDVRVKVSGLPEKAKISGQGSKTVTAEFAADEAGNGQSVVVAMVRDVSRCSNSTNQDSACSNLDDKRFSSYELTKQYTWRIDSGSADYLDQTFANQQASKTGANGGLTGCGNGMLSELASGRFLGSVLGCIKGVTDNQTK